MDFNFNREMCCLLLLVIISLINLGFGSASDSVPLIVGEKSCNGTVGDCFSSGGDLEILGAEEEDLLRHYGGGARWLLQSSSKTTTRTLQKPPVCRTGKYGNCLRSGGGSGRCTDYNRCSRSAG